MVTNEIIKMFYERSIIKTILTEQVYEKSVLCYF
jgi:hypothetical protein